MTFSSATALFLALVILAAIPGPGVLVVLSRSITGGFHAGMMTVFGIVSGDIVFIFLVLSGLSALSHAYEGFFLVLKYVGAAYLVSLGVKIILAKTSEAATDSLSGQYRHSTNFVSGLLTTLSNPKAILFYVSFFPAFIDISAINGGGIALVFLIAVVAVGSTMVLYVFIGVRSHQLINGTVLSRCLNYAGGCVLVASGVYVALRPL